MGERDDDLAPESERTGGSRAEGDGEPRGSQSERGRKAQNAHELLTDEIVHRSQRANPHLRACLSGKIIFELEGTPNRYMIDWTADSLKSSAAGDDEAECYITVSEQNLMRISSGELNPQVAMLSGKVKVRGKLGLAIYVFNLIGARHFLH